ncbi:MAG: Rieske (2Fe-2S) protein [Frankiaceae bacterium]
MSFPVEGRDNCVTVDGTPYVHVRTSAGSFVMAARCRHRGGPLNLAAHDPAGRRLVCPWHGGTRSVAALLRLVPAVRRGGTVTAVLPHDATAERSYGHRPLSADLRVGCREATDPGGR